MILKVFLTDKYKEVNDTRIFDTLKARISENFRDSLCTYVHTYNGIVHMYVCTQENAVVFSALFF